VVLDEGAEVRLLLSDRDGAPRGTLRANWPDAAAAARRSSPASRGRRSRRARRHVHDHPAQSCPARRG
jgi:hypothetical protein